eukprot:TRINITY_DN12552_c0_g1_i1.p1 TRINITY_DN12552_c0_g1~~TRINITY_DN12552_c0_g1_i1.p1  ORF type:complete len:703 (+),score=192.93 TRINITY_DN12552_c0_g1_i1:66-2111(+)
MSSKPTEGSVFERDDGSLSSLRSIGADLAALLREYAGLHQAKQVDFVVRDHFDALVPRRWHEPLLALPEELLRRLPVDLPVPPDWPECLKSFVLRCRALAPARLHAHPGVRSRSRPLQDSLMTTDLSQKKRHEVSMIAGAIDRVASSMDTQLSGVVDVGAGQGYLPSVLSQGDPSYPAVGVEARELNVTRAAQRQERIDASRAKRRRRQEPADAGAAAATECLWEVKQAGTPWRQLPKEVQRQLEAAHLSSEPSVTADGAVYTLAAGCCRLASGAEAELRRRVGKAQQKASPDCDTLWIGGLGPGATEQDLAEACAVAAGVVRVELRGRGAKPPQCFALFESPAAAAEAASVLSGRPAPGGGQLVAVVAKNSIATQGDGERSTAFVKQFLSRDADPAVFVSQVAEALPKRPGPTSLLLCGLHSCGALTPTMIRVFAAEPRLRALVVVGCCYYKAPWHDAVQRDYPMSRWTADSGVDLDLSSVRLACESTHRWSSMPDQEWNRMKDHTLDRVVLEAIGRRLWPAVGDRLVIRSVAKGVRESGFGAYAVAALKGARQRVERVRCAAAAPPDQPLSEQGEGVAATTASLPPPAEPFPTEEELELAASRQRSAELWMKLRVYLTLQQCLSPCIEGFVVLDRLMWLREALQSCPGASCAAIPVFEHSISHRNIAIVAVKGQSTVDG